MTSNLHTAYGFQAGAHIRVFPTRGQAALARAEAKRQRPVRALQQFKVGQLRPHSLHLTLQLHGVELGNPALVRPVRPRS